MFQHIYYQIYLKGYMPVPARLSKKKHPLYIDFSIIRGIIDSHSNSMEVFLL